MMTEISTDHEFFKKMLEKLFKQNVKDDPLQKFKEKAWERLQELGLPTRKTEIFQYIRLRALYTRSFELSSSINIDPSTLSAHILPECSQSVVIFVNGHYRPELSRLSSIPKKFIILPLQEASRTYGSFLSNQWNKLLKEENDPFCMLNASLYQNGLFLYVPPKTAVKTPLQILHITAVEDIPSLMTPRIQGFVGQQSQLELISTHAHLSGQESLLTSSIDIAIDEGSRVHYVQTPLDISKQAWHFDAFRASLKRDSTLKTILATEGTASLRQDYRVTLMGENAEASLNGIWMLSNNNEAHANILIEHQAPHCRSTQLFKTVTNDSSRSSFEGKIYVHREAQKTEAFQLNNNLILSDKAKADSKPNLEIFADDVKASHGATIGQLDSEQLFYLRTRGYSEQAAKNLLVHGFCKEVFDLIPYLSISTLIKDRARKYVASEY